MTARGICSGSGPRRLHSPPAPSETQHLSNADGLVPPRPGPALLSPAERHSVLSEAAVHGAMLRPEFQSSGTP